MAIDFTTAEGQVRLLINDTVEGSPVFSDGEITAYLSLEGGNVKRAAAQALDTIADDEALTSKVIRTQDLATDGAKIADSLRKRAAALRAQADADDANGEDGAYFEFVPMNGPACGPELTGIQYPLTGWP
jgi:hypothetical protein